MSKGGSGGGGGGGRKRVRVMPAIREESNLKHPTARIPVHIIPPGARPGARPAQSSMIIQTLPQEPGAPQPEVTPSNRHHDNVEQVVSDYLHYARYAKTVPVTHGFAPLPCPCCSDRNRENQQLKRERARPPPPEPDPDDIPGTTEPLPSGSRDHERDGARGGLSPRHEGGGGGYPTGGFPGSWMDYQPTPYAQTYLNSEFNRASLLKGYAEDRRQYEDASMAYVSSKVLDADAKYDVAMKRLERSLDKFAVTREDSDLSYQ